jgi:acetyl-CoA carboxylase biotin carboxylase subunit
VRVDAGYRAGNDVTPFYDPLLAKLAVWAEDRQLALARAREAVAGFRISGPKTNLPFFRALLDDVEFCSGDYDTRIIERMRTKGAGGG